MDVYVAQMAKNQLETPAAIKTLKTEIERAFAELKNEHKTLQQSFSCREAEFDRILKKAQKSIARHWSGEQKLTKQLFRDLKSCLFPAGIFQERHQNMLPYLCQQQLNFITLLVDTADVLTPRLLTVRL